VLDLPSINDVENGVIFDSTSFTGIFVVPSVGNVVDGEVYGANGEFTGTYECSEDFPGITDVRFGTSYNSGSLTGTLDLPSINDVQASVTFDNSTKTGVLTLPIVGNVRYAVEYGYDAEYTGTLYIPAIGNVRSGISYGSGQTEYTGNIVLPDQSNVLTTITYGLLGTEFTGEYICTTVAGSTTLISSAFKQLYITAINQLLADDALTVPCTLVYGDTKWTDCPNCKLLPNGRSSNIYQTGGPLPFTHGVCEYCHGVGRLPETSEDSVYLAVIFDSKSWIKWSKESVSPHSPASFVQTISKFAETYTKLKKAKYVVMDTNIEDNTRSRYERFAEPEPVGLGASTYVITMWKRIG